MIDQILRFHIRSHNCEDATDEAWMGWLFMLTQDAEAIVDVNSFQRFKTDLGEYVQVRFEAEHYYTSANFPLSSYTSDARPDISIFSLR